MEESMVAHLDSMDSYKPVKIQVLQRRIGWLCQLGRLLAAAYALWTLWLVVSFWSDPNRVARRFSMISGAEVRDIGSGTLFTGLALYVLDWAVLALTCYWAWQLFTGYMQGRIFTAGAAGLLRRVTLAGIAAVVADIVIRPFVVLLVAGRVPAFSVASYYYFSPHDLALLTLLVSLFAIAHIFKVAAELAEENAEIL
jgi:hypothetical protein